MTPIPLHPAGVMAQGVCQGPTWQGSPIKEQRGTRPGQMCPAVPGSVTTSSWPTTTRKGFGQHRAPVYPEREKRIQGLDVTHEVTVYGRNQVLHVSSKEEEEEKAVL